MSNKAIKSSIDIYEYDTVKIKFTVKMESSADFLLLFEIYPSQWIVHVYARLKV